MMFVLSEAAARAAGKSLNAAAAAACWRRDGEPRGDSAVSEAAMDRFSILRFAQPLRPWRNTLAAAGLATWLAGCAGTPAPHAAEDKPAATAAPVAPAAPPPVAAVSAPAAKAPVAADGPVAFMIIESSAPPAAPEDPVPARPPGNDTWVAGHWIWSGESYEWVPGRWVTPPTLNARWIPPRWEPEGGAFRFYAGCWN
jgi:hypothetical protein